MLSVLEKVLQHNGLVTALALVGIVMGLSMWVSEKLTFGRIHGSVVVIIIGLVLVYWGGMQISGERDLANLKLFGEVSLMGGAMLRDFAIVATAFEVQVAEVHKADMIGAISLLLGMVLPFIVGACVAYAFDYTDPVSVTTVGTGAVTHIVGPVTGVALSAASDMMALSIATGFVKAILVMIGTPFAAKAFGLNNPHVAMVFGRLASTVSGVSAGLAATDRRLVPCGSLVATFHTSLDRLLGPSTLFLAIQALLQ